MSELAQRRLGQWSALLSLAALAGCLDVGLAGRNTPETEAANSEWRYRVYDIGQPANAVTEITLGTAAAAEAGAGAQEPLHWLSSAETVEIPQELLRPIGAADGATVFALVWDEAPYDRLYTPAPRAGAYHPMNPVLPPAQPHEEAAAPESEHGAH
ncbi:MAG: hypothetical protein ACRELX_07780 [Longimicrobiales bacterium]